MINSSYDCILERLSMYGIGGGSEYSEDSYALTESQLGVFYYNAIVSEAFDELIGSDDIVAPVNEAGNNREMASILSNASKQYKSALKESRAYAKKNSYQIAIKCIESARKSLKESEQAIESVPGSAFTTIKGWILSWLIGIVKSFVPNLMVKKGTVGIDLRDFDFGFDDLLNNFKDYGIHDEEASLLNEFKLPKLPKAQLNTLGKIGKGLNCINSFTGVVSDIYGIGKTIVDKGTVGQALNTFRSKILSIIALMDKTLALYEKDLTRKANA